MYADENEFTQKFPLGHNPYRLMALLDLVRLSAGASFALVCISVTIVDAVYYRTALATAKQISLVD